MQFHGIGSLGEQPTGSEAFTVGEHLNVRILYSPEHKQPYEASSSKGPSDTVWEYCSTIVNLNENFAEEDEDGATYVPSSLNNERQLGDGLGDALDSARFDMALSPI